MADYASLIRPTGYIGVYAIIFLRTEKYLEAPMYDFTTAEQIVERANDPKWNFTTEYNDTGIPQLAAFEKGAHEEMTKAIYRSAVVIATLLFNIAKTAESIDKKSEQLASIQDEIRDIYNKPGG